MRERDITEHSSYLVGPYVIVPYGAAAQKLKREGHAGRNQVLDGWGRDEGIKGWRDEMNSGEKFDFFFVSRSVEVAQKNFHQLHGNDLLHSTVPTVSTVSTVPTI